MPLPPLGGKGHEYGLPVCRAGAFFDAKALRRIEEALGIGHKADVNFDTKVLEEFEAAGLRRARRAGCSDPAVETLNSSDAGAGDDGGHHFTRNTDQLVRVEAAVNRVSGLSTSHRLGRGDQVWQ